MVISQEPKTHSLPIEFCGYVLELLKKIEVNENFQFTCVRFDFHEPGYFGFLKYTYAIKTLKRCSS